MKREFYRVKYRDDETIPIENGIQVNSHTIYCYDHSDAMAHARIWTPSGKFPIFISRSVLDEYEEYVDIKDFIENGKGAESWNYFHVSKHRTFGRAISRHKSNNHKSGYDVFFEVYTEYPDYVFAYDPWGTVEWGRTYMLHSLNGEITTGDKVPAKYRPFTYEIPTKNHNLPWAD